jgi:hypothetical protein
MASFWHLIDLKSVLSKPNQNHSMRTFCTSSAFLAAWVFSASALLAAQEQGQTQGQTPVQQSAPSTESSSQQKPGQSASKHSNDFLVRGTVFTQEGLSLPGAELRIRRTSEKKSRWQTTSNSRGDFAVRVKMGSDYEVTVRAKGYQEQTLSVDAKTGDRFKDLVFRMQHQGGKKS